MITFSLLPTAAVLFLVYNDHFSEFKEEFNVGDRVYCFSKQTSIFLRRLYPVILSVEMMVVPILLTTQSISNVSLYAVLAVEILVTIYIWMVPLYSFFRQNVRNYIHRGIIVLICFFQIMTLYIRKETHPADSFVYWLPAVLLFLIVAGFLCTGTYIIHQSVEFWKGPDLADEMLKLEQ